MQAIDRAGALFRFAAHGFRTHSAPQAWTRPSLERVAALSASSGVCSVRRPSRRREHKAGVGGKQLALVVNDSQHAGHHRKRMRWLFSPEARSACTQRALENIEPPGGIGGRIVGRAFAEMAVPLAQNRRADILHAIPPLCRQGLGKPIQRGVAIGLPGVQPRRRIIGTVRGVGIDLRLQAQRVVLAVHPAYFPVNAASRGN